MQKLFIVAYPPHPHGAAGNNGRSADIKIAEASHLDEADSIATVMIQNYPNYHVVVGKILRIYKLPEIPIPQGFEMTDDGEMLPL